MTALTLSANDISASEERGAIISQYITAADVILGQAVYLDANNQVSPAKADSSAHANAIGIAVIADNFYGETTIKSGGTAGVVVYGPVWGFSGLTSGEQGWVDKTTAGTINDTAPTGGAYQYAVGRAIDSETFFVDPGTTTPLSHA